MPQHEGKWWHNHKYTKKRRNYNTKTQELFKDVSREVDDAVT